jgi:alpha-1,2-mannosyltransferase
VPEPFARRWLVALFTFLWVPFAYHYGWALVPGTSVDFPSYHYAAVMAFLEGKSPFGPGAFDAASAQMYQHVHPFVYPPPSLIAFWPLALMSFGTGKAAFIVASHICYLAAVWIILSKLTPLPDEARRRELTIAAALLYLFLFDPAQVTLGLGQVNLIVLPFLFLALAAMRANAQAWQIALPLSAAILLKTYPALLLLPLLFRGNFKAIVLTCVFYGIYALIALVTLPLDVWSTWFTGVLPHGGYTKNLGAASGPWNQNINAFVCRLFLENPWSDAPLRAPALAAPVANVLGLAVLGATAWFGFRDSRRNPGRPIGDAEIAALLLMIFLIAPLSWEHHFVYVLPAAILAIAMMCKGEVKAVAAAALLAALFVIAWRVPFAEPPLRKGWWTLLISVKFYAAAGLWLFFLNRLRRTAATPADSSHALSTGISSCFTTLVASSAS